MKKEKPACGSMFLYRQGIKLTPSQNFLDKFKEEYNIASINCKNKRHKHKDIDDRTALFFLNCVFSAIVYCLDFGFNVHLYHKIQFNNKIYDFINNSGKVKSAIVENLKRINITLFSNIRRKMQHNMNVNNEEYQKYLKEKEKHQKEIKLYYRKFYNKDDEWWQNLKDDNTYGN